MHSAPILVASQADSNGAITIHLAMPKPEAAEGSPLISWDATGLERETLRKLASDGELCAVRIGRCFYVKRSDLVALFDRRAELTTRKRTKAARAAVASPASVGAALAAKIRGAK